MPLLFLVFFSFSVLRITEILLFLCIRTGGDGIRKTLFSKLVTSLIYDLEIYDTKSLGYLCTRS